MKSNKTIYGIVLFAAVSSTIFNGCSTRVLDFTIISSKQMDVRVKPTGKGRRVVGKDGVYWLFTIPLGAPNLKQAVDRAIEKAGPGYDALIDGVIYTEKYWYLISGYSGYKVVGTPVKTSELKLSLLRDSKHFDFTAQNMLFHSSLNISNESTLAKIGIVEVNDLESVKPLPDYQIDMQTRAVR